MGISVAENDDDDFGRKSDQHHSEAVKAARTKRKEMGDSDLMTLRVCSDDGLVQETWPTL